MGSCHAPAQSIAVAHLPTFTSARPSLQTLGVMAAIEVGNMAGLQFLSVKVSEEHPHLEFKTWYRVAEVKSVDK